MVQAGKKLMRKHHLQRLHSPSRSASAIFHALSLCSFAGSFWYLTAWPTFVNESYGWHYQYLTILGLCGATLTFVFGLLADFTLNPTLFFIKNTLSLCSAPLEVLIAILYWGISAIDKTLLIPPDIELSHYADIGFHFIPAFVLTIDILFFSPPWTLGAVPAMGVSSLIAVAYWFWTERCFNNNGFYPYPLFGLLTTTQRVGLFIGAALLMTMSTIWLQWLYSRFNGVERSQKKATPANIKGE